MKIKRLLRKMKYFVKRNAYALAVCVCVVLALTLLSVAALKYGEGQTVDVGINEEQNAPVSTPTVITFTSPIENATVYKEYADDHLLEDKTSGYYQTHQAIDFVASAGSAVKSVLDGTVESVNHSMMDGLVITIKHSGNLKTVYKCLADEAEVKEGDKVKAGQEIGKVGTNLTEKADGVHLHFELYENDKLVDPTPYFTDMGK